MIGEIEMDDKWNEMVKKAKAEKKRLIRWAYKKMTTPSKSDINNLKKK